MGDAFPLATSSFQIPKSRSKNDRLAIVGDGRPEDAAILEGRDLLRRAAAHGLLPDILGAPGIAHEIHTRAVGAPHRPQAFEIAAMQLLVLRRTQVRNPDLALIQVTVALPPPLPAGISARGESQHLAVGR